MWPFTPLWRKISEYKRSERQERIHAITELVSSNGNSPRYLEATAVEIVKRIEIGEWTALDVLKAYIMRATLAQQATNAVTEVLFSEALKEAEALDSEFSQTKKLKGPLHGVPVSFKDQFGIVGYDASIGFSAWCNKPSTRDAELVRIVRSAGGIPFVKTNVPQTMLSFECSNPVFGRTTNPWSSLHIPGGSSGGEAALLACDGSALGFGTDIGGSLRIPALFSGVYAFKPGAGRVSSKGAVRINPGFNGLQSVAGPMGRSMDDVDMASRLVFGVSPASCDTVYPIPYRSVELPERLKFGYFLSDGCVKASPASRRAILETISALQNAGHECIEFDVAQFDQSLPIFCGLTAADGYQTLLAPIGSDPQEESMFIATLGPKLPNFIRTFASWIIKHFIGDTYFPKLFAHSRKQSVRDFWQHVKQRDELTDLFYDKVWDHYGFDGVIAPGFSTPALPHGATRNLSALAVATVLFNVIDSPVGVIPVTRVDPKLDALTKEWFTGAGRGSKLLETNLYGGADSSKKVPYDPVAMKGLPVGVQIVGKRWEEEKVLGMMKIVDDVLGKREFGPGIWKPERGKA